MVSMKWCNFVVCIAGLAMGGCMMGASSRFPMDMTEQGPGPGFWPFLLGQFSPQLEQSWLQFSLILS